MKPTVDFSHLRGEKRKDFRQHHVSPRRASQPLGIQQEVDMQGLHSSESELYFPLRDPVLTFKYIPENYMDVKKTNNSHEYIRLYNPCLFVVFILTLLLDE